MNDEMDQGAGADMHESADHKMEFKCPHCGDKKEMHHEHPMHVEGDKCHCHACEFTDQVPTCDGCRVTMELVREAEDSAA